MSENFGWISLHRQIKKHWIWNDPVKFQRWIDILLTVNIEDKKVNIGMDIILCKRGECLMSIQNWATRWKVSKSAARNFLDLLKKENMIETKPVSKTTRITVCNFDSYQAPVHDGNTMEARSKHDGHTQLNKSNKKNKNNNSSSSRTEVLSEPLVSESSLHRMVCETWLKKVHPGWTFTAKHGKEIKAICGKLKTVLQTSGEAAPTDAQLSDAFTYLCRNLPDFYRDKDLGKINSAFNEIVTEIKNKQNGQQINSNSKHSAVAYRS